MAAAVSRAAILEAAQCEDESEAYELSLHHTGLRSMLGLSKCVRLRVLDLSFNSLRSIEGLDALGDLRELRLYANEITHIYGLQRVVKLQTLLLHDNRLGADCNPGGEGLLALTQLDTLHVGTNHRLGSAGLSELRLDQLDEPRRPLHRRARRRHTAPCPDADVHRRRGRGLLEHLDTTGRARANQTPTKPCPAAASACGPCAPAAALPSRRWGSSTTTRRCAAGRSTACRFSG